MPVTWTLKQWLRSQHGLTNAKHVRDIIQGRAGQEISLRSIKNLLKNKPKTLDIRTLQAICDVFRCQLKHFCAVKPSPIPPLKRTPIHIQHLIQPCGLAPNETLRSFIARIQMAGIRQALLISGNNFCYACRLLGSERGYLLPLYQRRTKTPHGLNPAPKQSRAKAVLLPAAMFTIRPDEDFQSFTRRIQVAAIIRTIKMEGNHSRAALRLGYNRTAFVILRSRLLNDDLQLQSIQNRDLQLQARLQPCAIASHETLNSFVARVKLAAVEETVSKTDTYGQAAQRLDYRRTSLHTLHARLKRTTTLNNNASGKRTRTILSQVVPLRRTLFTIQRNECLESFIRRIQLAAITQTTRLEGNHTRAALRLGYRRTSLVTLISKLKARSGD